MPLAGCGMTGRPGADITDVPVDTGAALSAVNGYRAGSGLHRLDLDPRLNAAARAMARLMAERDSSNPRAHNATALSRRIRAAGLETTAGAENIVSGAASFAAALASWKGSPDHDKNLLNPHVTRVGFAHVRRSDGKWRNFWVMVLARPKEDGPPRL